MKHGLTVLVTFLVLLIDHYAHGQLGNACAAVVSQFFSVLGSL